MLYGCVVVSVYNIELLEWVVVRSSYTKRNERVGERRCVSIIEIIENRPPKTKGFGNHRERESTIVYITYKKTRNEDQ